MSGVGVVVVLQHTHGYPAALLPHPACVLQCVAVCCSVLQCVAALQCVARLSCSTLAPSCRASGSALIERILGFGIQELGKYVCVAQERDYIGVWDSGIEL